MLMAAPVDQKMTNSPKYHIHKTLENIEFLALKKIRCLSMQFQNTLGFQALS